MNIKPSIPFVVAVALALSACSEERGSAPAPEPTADPVVARDAPAAAPPPVSPDEGAPAETAHVSGPLPAAGTIGFEGFGPAAFGSSEEEVRMAWGSDLGEAAPSEPGGCYYLAPQPPPADGYRIAFMIEGDRFSRVDVRAEEVVAPGGGRVGMNAEEIGRLYGDRVERRPHKYVEGARYLRIPDAAGGNGVLLFATDADGRVTEWRVGVPPQVDYVEGCS